MSIVDLKGVSFKVIIIGDSSTFLTNIIHRRGQDLPHSQVHPRGVPLLIQHHRRRRLQVQNRPPLKHLRPTTNLGYRKSLCYKQYSVASKSTGA